jgi:hypothetical protein
MIRRSTAGALLVCAVALAACQTAGIQSAGGPPVEGRWASGDGLSVSTLRQGRLVTRVTNTGEVVADGTYAVEGGQVNFSWFSIAAQQQRSAVCTFAGPNALRCSQAGGSSFDLTRIA